MKLNLFKRKLLILNAVVTALIITSCTKDEPLNTDYTSAANNIITTSDGNMLIAGYTYISSGSYNGLLAKISSATGDTLWSHNYGSSNADALYDVAMARDGGYVATGFSNKSSTGSPTMLALITDASGKQVKAVTYGGSSYSQGFSVIQDVYSDSGYIICGYIQKNSTADRDIYIVKIDDDGTKIWERIIGVTSVLGYDSTANEAAYCIVPGGDSSYYITGTANGYLSGDGDISLVKLTADCKPIWSKTYGKGFGYSLVYTADGNLAVSGSSLKDASNQNVFLFKADTAGVLKWPAIAYYDNGGFDFSGGMVETSDGGFAITGITDGKGNGTHDMLLLITNSTGEAVASKTFGTPSVDQGFGITKLIDGFGIAGLSNSNGSSVMIVKTNNSGNTDTGWTKYLAF